MKEIIAKDGKNFHDNMIKMFLSVKSQINMKDKNKFRD